MNKKIIILIVVFLTVFIFYGRACWAQSDTDAVDKILDQYEKNLSTGNSPKVIGKADAVSGGSSSKIIEHKSNNDIVLDVLELKDMEIGDVLKLISKKTGLNIVAGNNVRGKVTIYLKNVAAKEALRIILETHNLAFVEENGIIKVMTNQDYEKIYGHKFGDRTEIKVIQLVDSQSSEILPLLNQVKSSIGKVIADDKSNTLILRDTPENIEKMRQLIRRVDIPSETKVFELSYAKAEGIAKKIEEMLTPNVGHLKYDERSNRIIVTDTPQKLEEIQHMIKTFDKRSLQVLIEAKIVQIILSDQYKMGVDWEAIVSDYHTLDMKSDFDILTSNDKKGTLSIGTLTKDDYTVLLEALNTVGTTNTLSSPRIMALNNEEAKILVGSTQPYVTTTTTTPATGATTTAESVNFIDVGVKLYVTPTIHNDNFITMKIRPEVSSVTQFLTTSNNNTIPVVDTSEAETSVLVKDGVTIVIGGLIKDEKVKTVKKVPFLGDLPVLGGMFRNKDNLVKKTELVIFLTPHIVKGDEGLFSPAISDFSEVQKNLDK